MAMFDALRKAFLAKPQTSAGLTVALEKAEAIKTQLQGKLVGLTKDRTESLLAEDDVLTKIKAAMVETDEQIEIAAAWCTKISQALASKLLEEEQGRRQAMYDATKVKAEAAGSFCKEYARGAAIVLKALRTLAEAQLAIAETNAALPDGAAGFGDPEHTFNCIPGLPKKILSEGVVDLWVLDGRADPVEDQKRVVPDTQGGYLPQPGSQTAGGLRVHKEKFLRRSILPEMYNIWRDQTLAKLHLPGFYAPQIVGWDGPSPYLTWQQANAAIEAIEAPPARTKPVDNRKPVIEHVRVSADGEVMG